MKKGFTLIELLCVIVIIAIISLITFPRVTKYINNAREELYVTQVKNIEKQGEKWALNNMDYLDKYHINDTFVTLNLLKETKYLEKDDILNPKTKEVMNGCILISYENNKYSYEYIEEDCSLSNKDLSEYSDSYIIYDYDVDKYEIKTLGSKQNIPAYQVILNNNNISVLGESIDGLYELENEYVFRGNNVNNYVKYEGKEWRILSIDKKDYSMKLISTTSLSSTLSGENTTDFTKTTLQGTLKEKVEDYSKIVDTSWYSGIISDNASNLVNLENNLKTSTISSKVGLLSLYDYAIASTDNSCENNFKDSACKNNNYIATMFESKRIWTMNTNGEKFWYIDLETEESQLINNQVPQLADATSGPYYYATVIKLPINIYVSDSNATGTEKNVYVLN